MTRRRLLTILLAGALAFLGVAVVLVYVHGAVKRAAGQNDPVRVLAAVQPVSAGTPVQAALNQHLVERVKYPKGSLPWNAVEMTDRQQDGEVFTSALRAGQIVTSDMFGTRSQTSTSLVPPPHTVLLSIGVCQTAAVAGYLGPGSTVAVDDITGTNASCSSHESSAKNVGASVILSSVTVMSVHGAPPPQASSSSSGIAATADTAGCSSSQGMMCVTLAVPTALQLKLAKAASTGFLYLALLGANSAPPATGTSSASP